MKTTVFFVAMIVITTLISPVSAHARYEGEVGGWIPWWQDTMGTESAEDHLSDLDVIYPFVFEVKIDGTLEDKGDLDESKWRSLIKKANKKKIDVIPTIAWFDGEAIHRVLSNKILRERHIEEIVDMVEDGDFDGVNIDYESKKSETMDYFSLFLKELKDELGSADLTCTIEARMPAESRYREVPAVITYANDYKAMNRYCDWVEIMAYDQQRADLLLNDARKGEPYNPVADRDWVEKVITLALKDIDADKIMLGVATYGREWEITVKPDWYSSYRSQGAINIPDALEIAEEYDVKPGRNKAGEMSFTYFPEDSIFKVLNVLETPKGTRTGFEAAAKALLFANYTGMAVPVNLVWYSDAGAIEDKVKLAEKFDLRGIALFKIDGEEDEDIWDLF